MEATKKITYQGYKEQRQSKFNALPIFFAFDNKQLEEGMQKHWRWPGRCPNVENAGKYLYSIGGGGYYFKKDAPVIRAWSAKPDPITELLKDPDFAFSAFYYEMGNHEYHINTYQANWDVLSCFGDVEYCQDDYNFEQYFDQLKFESQTREAYRKARRKFLEDAEKNDWY